MDENNTYKRLANLASLVVNKTEGASHFIDNRSAGYNLFTVYAWSIVPHDINRQAGLLRSFFPHHRKLHEYV